MNDDLGLEKLEKALGSAGCPPDEAAKHVTELSKLVDGAVVTRLMEEKPEIGSDQKSIEEYLESNAEDPAIRQIVDEETEKIVTEYLATALSGLSADQKAKFTEAING